MADPSEGDRGECYGYGDRPIRAWRRDHLHSFVRTCTTSTAHRAARSPSHLIKPLSPGNFVLNCEGSRSIKSMDAACTAWAKALSYLRGHLILLKDTPYLD